MDQLTSSVCRRTCDTILFKMTVSDRCEVALNAIVTSTRGIETRIDFTLGPDLDHVIEHDCSRLLQTIAKRAASATEETRYPELQFSRPGILIADCYASHISIFDGGAHVEVRFCQVYGDAQRLLMSNVMAMNLAHPEANEAVDITLEHALIPIFDLGAYLREQIDEIEKDGGVISPTALRALLEHIDAVERSYDAVRRCSLGGQFGSDEGDYYLAAS